MNRKDNYNYKNQENDNQYFKEQEYKRISYGQPPISNNKNMLIQKSSNTLQDYEHYQIQQQLQAQKQLELLKGKMFNRNQNQYVQQDDHYQQYISDQRQSPQNNKNKLPQIQHANQGPYIEKYQAMKQQTIKAPARQQKEWDFDTTADANQNKYEPINYAHLREDQKQSPKINQQMQSKAQIKHEGQWSQNQSIDAKKQANFQDYDPKDQFKTISQLNYQQPKVSSSPIGQIGQFPIQSFGGGRNQGKDYKVRPPWGSQFDDTDVALDHNSGNNMNINGNDNKFSAEQQSLLIQKDQSNAVYNANPNQNKQQNAQIRQEKYIQQSYVKESIQNVKVNAQQQAKFNKVSKTEESKLEEAFPSKINQSKQNQQKQQKNEVYNEPIMVQQKPDSSRIAAKQKQNPNYSQQQIQSKQNNQERPARLQEEAPLKQSASNYQYQQANKQTISSNNNNIRSIEDIPIAQLKVKQAQQQLFQEQIVQQPVYKPQQQQPQQQQFQMKLQQPSEYANVGQLHPCGVCGRRFASETIGKHQKACQKASKPRKVFDSTKQRQVADNNENNQQYQSKNAATGQPYNTKYTTAQMAQQKNNKKQGKWKLQSEAFRANMRQARGGVLSKKEQQAMKQGFEEMQDLVDCMWCGRKFNQIVAERHIPFCENKYKQAQLRMPAAQNHAGGSKNVSRLTRKR